MLKYFRKTNSDAMVIVISGNFLVYAGAFFLYFIVHLHQNVTVLVGKVSYLGWLLGQ